MRGGEEETRIIFDLFVHVVGKALVWWSWDYNSNRLYIIDLKVRNHFLLSLLPRSLLPAINSLTLTQAKKNLCLFRAFQFPETAFVSVLSMSLPSIPSPQGNPLYSSSFSSSDIDFYFLFVDIDVSFPYPYSFFAKPHQTTSHSAMTLVKLPKNGNLCLCLQYSHNTTSNSSPIHSPTLPQSSSGQTQSWRNYRDYTKSDQPPSHSSAPHPRMSASVNGLQSKIGNLHLSGGSDTGSSGNFESFFNGPSTLGDSIGSVEDDFGFMEQKYTPPLYAYLFFVCLLTCSSAASTHNVFISVFILDIRRRVDISIPIDPSIFSPTVPTLALASTDLTPLHPTRAHFFILSYLFFTTH